jgi:hypothetical protein
VHLPFNECVSSCQPYDDHALRALETQLSKTTGFSTFRYAADQRFPTHHAIVEVCKMFETQGKLEEFKLILGPRGNVANAIIAPENEVLYNRMVRSEQPYTLEKYPISEAYVIWALLQRVLDRSDRLGTIKIIRLCELPKRILGSKDREVWLDDCGYQPFFDEVKKRGWSVENTYIYE